MDLLNLILFVLIVGIFLGSEKWIVKIQRIMLYRVFGIIERDKNEREGVIDVEKICQDLKEGRIKIVRKW